MSFGALATMLVGFCYVAFAIAFAMLPPDLQPLATPPEQFLPATTRHDLTLAIGRAAFVLANVFALAAIPAIGSRIRRPGDELLRWTETLAYLGFAVNIVTELRRADLLPRIGDVYTHADPAVRPAVALMEKMTPLEPFGLLGFGAIGAWVLASSALGLRRAVGPRALGILGISLAIGYWIVLVGFATSNALLIQIGAGIGGALIGPVWYLWHGMTLRGVGPQQYVVRNEAATAG